MPPRVAFSIGRRVGPAVVRNRLRRRLRSLLQDASGDLHSGSYLVSARPAAAALDYPALGSALMGALVDLGTLENEVTGPSYPGSSERPR